MRAEDQEVVNVYCVLYFFTIDISWLAKELVNLRANTKHKHKEAEYLSSPNF